MIIKKLISDDEIARQIACLVNENHNASGWRISFTKQGISRSPALYIVESLDHVVLGVVGLRRRQGDMSEIMHLVVMPEMRRQGLAKRLISRAVEESPTKIVYAKVRDDNIPSLKTFMSLGFFPKRTFPRKGYGLIMMMRFKDNNTNNALLESIRR